MPVKRGKKGQLTVFIVIGLVILIAASFIFYFTTKAGKEGLEKEPLTSGGRTLILVKSSYD